MPEWTQSTRVALCTVGSRDDKQSEEFLKENQSSKSLLKFITQFWMDHSIPGSSKMIRNYTPGSGAQQRRSNSSSFLVRQDKVTSFSHTNNEDDTDLNASKRQKLDGSYLGPNGPNKTDADVIPGSPWEWRRMKGELIALKARLSHQEATIDQLHKLRGEMEEVFKKEKRMMEIQAEQDKQTIKQLELRIDVGRRTLQDAKAAQMRAERDLIQMKSKMEQKVLAVIADNTRLQEELQGQGKTDFKPDLKAINAALLDQSEQKLSDSDEKYETAIKRINELEEKLREARECQQKFEVQGVELQNMRIKIESLESEKKFLEDAKKVSNVAAQTCDLQRELQHARDIIVSLRESVKGKLLLEEQMASVEHRLKRTESLERQVSQLEISQADLLAKIAEYEAVGISGGPIAIRREINRLRQAEVLLTEEEGQLRYKMDALQKELEKSQQMNEETKKSLAEVTNSYDRLSRFVNRVQKKMSLVTRERDSYRQQLDTYEKEITGYINNETPNLINERVPALERAIEGYRELVAKLESDLEAVDGKHQKEENKKLREEVDRLKGELEHRALKGDFNINSKILHFKMNPAALAEKQAEEKQKALLQEVEQLRAIVASGNLSENLPVSSLHAQEIADLQQKHDLKISRLKEAFKASSHEYRQACYQLFGWRVDRTKEGQYKLSSQYAESPDDYLFFLVNEDGVNMVETPFSSTLTDLIQRHLQIQHSVPMFLNAVQSDLFNQQTVTMNLTEAVN
ncbi:hypothetical protein QAD02_011777 [Eretmocerus hayati]|uniref:Uncharacterized protein n=1 Tax=Eretmocerus hayati TaxID=131215 RepID=A0ACC2NYX2_9HYME|nr:hypothetical protein QAD02_011777 [Eretmocerus hayati]